MFFFAIMKDYYQILALDPLATQSVINKAFSLIIRNFHPEINKKAGAREIFINKIEAHYVLAHSQKREQYDKLYFKQKSGEMPISKVNLPDKVIEKNLKNWSKEGREKGIIMAKADLNKLIDSLPKYTWRDKLIGFIFRKMSKQ